MTAGGADTGPSRGGPRTLGFVIVPALVVAAVALYPLLYNIWISLHVNNLSQADGEFAGLLNYRNVFAFDDFWSVLRTTLIWTLGSIAVQFVIGFVAALALDTGIRGAGVIRALLLTPWVMPGVVIGAVWLAIYHPISGLLTEVLGWFGADGVDLLGRSSTALPAVIFANVWKGFPFWMLMISAGLRAIPSELHEAAAMDGASYRQRIRAVVLPGLSTVLALTGTLAFIWTFNYFDLIYTLTSGGPNGATSTVPFLIWQTSFQFNRLDEGAAQSVLTFALMAVAIGSYLRVSKATAR
ncbi:carbohydrate ABC transporter permease [Nakamurella lactea]|uniref:carbohydrate ABC transporter permease n=1 Tax=Nakamurella lactea TaxID=459515 RepID=UPI000687107C|nr:sugar ABC transporter permease [Nakamurella lactea]